MRNTRKVVISRSFLNTNLQFIFRHYSRKVSKYLIFSWCTLETQLIEEHQNRKDMEVNDNIEHGNGNSKETKADISSYLQKLMIEARFDADERQMNSVILLSFKSVALLSLTEKLHEMKETNLAK